ncbi:MAG: hypothetical protein PHO71_23480, partial [Bacteroides sp.]|nr:hypothetical protein [Bacteroides sp.]
MEKQKRFGKVSHHQQKLGMNLPGRSQETTESKVSKWTKRCSLALLFILMLSIFTVGMIGGGFSITDENENYNSTNVAEASGGSSSTLQTFSMDLTAGQIVYNFTPNGASYGDSWGPDSLSPSGSSGQMKNDPGMHNGKDYTTMWVDIDLGATATSLLANGLATLSCSAVGYKSSNTSGGCYVSIQSSSSQFTQYGSSYSTAYSASQSNSITLGTSAATITKSFSSGRYIRFYLSGMDDGGWATGEWGWIETYNMSMTFTLTAFGTSDVGSSGDPFIISSLSRLQNLQTAVNTCGWTMSNRYFQQTTNISSLNSISIGTSSYYFQGNYNGNSYTLSGLSISNTTSYQALFGYTSGATISNLTISGTVGGSGNGRAGFVGCVKGNTTIENCTNNVNVSGNSYVGGFVGDVWGGTATISGCINNGSITGAGDGTGGIIGYVSSGYTATIQNSASRATSNSGTIVKSNTSNGTGGIIGYVNGTATVGGTTANTGSVYQSAIGNGVGGIVGYVSGTCTVQGSSAASTINNSGAIGSASYSPVGVGGIVGYGSSNTLVKYCKNTNNVYGANGTAGIIGQAIGSNVSYVNNSGAVTSTGNYVGGVLGALAIGGADLLSCINSGAVIGVSYVGGIVGETNGITFSGSAINQNLAGGTVNGTSYVGGIVGHALGASSVNGAKNYATITASSSNSGGIAGYVEASSTVSNCTNSGMLNGYSYAGGIVGYLTASTVSGCANSVAVNSTGDNIGGIIGGALSSSSITSNTNTGAVTYTGASASYGYSTGGIVGYLSGTSSVVLCSNEATVASSQKVGGIVGYQLSGTTISQSKNSGNITLSSVVNSTLNNRALGGIVGYSDATAVGSIIRCLNTGNIVKNGATYAGYAGGIIGNYAATAAASGVVNKCYSNASVIEASTAIGGIAGTSTASASYSIFTESWAFITYVGSTGVATPTVTTAASDDTGRYFVREVDTDCTTSVWDLTNFEAATYAASPTNITDILFSLTPDEACQNGYYFRLVTNNGTLVGTSAFTSSFDTETKKITLVEGSVSASNPVAYGTSTGIYHIVMSYQPLELFANTIYNRAVQTMPSVFEQTASSLISNCGTDGVNIYDFTYYNYYLDAACMMLTETIVAGASIAGGAPMNVNRSELNVVIPYGVVVGVYLPNTSTYVGFANTEFTVNPVPLALIEDPDARAAYTYNGRLQAVGAAIIGIDGTDALYAALPTALKTSITSAFNTEYDLGLVEAGADMVDYTTVMFADTSDVNADWRSDRLPGSSGYGLTMPVQIDDVGTYIIIPRGSIAGNGINNYEVTEDNGLSTNTNEYTVTLMKKSITLSDFIQHLYATNVSNDIDYTIGNLILGKYYDNHLFSAPELFNLAVYNMNNTHMYDDDFYNGTDNYLSFFNISYEWSEILPYTTWSSYLPSSYSDGLNGDDYAYNMSLQITVAINNVYYEYNTGSDFRLQARDNFNFGYNSSNIDYYYMRLTLAHSGTHVVEYSVDGLDWTTSTTSAMSGYSTGAPVYTAYDNSTVTLWYTSGGTKVNCTPRYLYSTIKDVGYGFNTYSTPQLYFDNAADAVGLDYRPSMRWGATDNPYWVLNAAQLQLIADTVNGASANSVQTITAVNSGYYGINWFSKFGVEQINNYDNWRSEGAIATAIDYTGAIFRMKNNIGTVTAVTFAGTSQNPIGVSSSYYFSGIFDGNGYTLTVNNSRNVDYSGLFGYTMYATIKNLSIAGSVTASSGNYIGSIVGYSAYSDFENCNVTATVNASGSYVGGLIGYLYGGAMSTTVKDCQNLNTISGYAVTGNDYVGGLIGYAYGIATISGEITNKGNVTATNASGYVGGIIGTTNSPSTTISTLTNAVNIGKVDGFKYAGGIVGYLGGRWKLSYCYNQGDLLLTYSSSTTVGIGGIVGYNNSSISSTGESSSITYCYNEYIPSVHGLISSTGFATTPITIGGLVGSRASGDGSPQIFNSWNVYNCTQAQMTALGHNTGNYDDGGYVYGKFILMSQGDNVNSYVYGMSYEEWIRVVGNIKTNINDNGDRSATDQYAWGSGAVGLGNIYFKLSAATGTYVRVSVYGGSNFANSAVFMLDVTKGDPNTTGDDETYWTGNSNSLVCMYIQSKASAANLIVGFGSVAAKDPMFIGETYYTENDMLQLLTAPAFSESSAYFNMSDGVRRTYITNIAQIDGEDGNTTSWDKGDTVSFTVYIYYYFQQVAATTTYYDGWVRDLQNGTHIYNRTTGEYEPSASGEYIFVEDIGMQEGIWVGQASFTLEIQNLIVEFSYTNFNIVAEDGTNVDIGGDGFSKYYDNYNGFYGVISQPSQGDDDRYPYGVLTTEVKAYFDTLTITVQQVGSYYPHYAKSSNSWVTSSYFATSNHNDSIYGATKYVGDNLYVWFCISITSTQLSEYENITFANPNATTSGVTCTSGDQTYIWVCTPTAVASILQRPIVVTPIIETKTYDGLGYTETYSSGTYGSTKIGDSYDGNSAAYYKASTSNLQYVVSYPRYARFDGTTGGGITYQNSDTNLLISSISSTLKGTFTITEMDIESIVIASGSTRTDLEALVEAGTATVADYYSYLSSTGSVVEGQHSDKKEIYIPGKYCYSINNFATANATNYNVIFNNGYDEDTGKWTVGSASGTYSSTTGLWDGTTATPYFEISGWQSSDYSSSYINGTTTANYGSTKRAVFATATTANILNGSKTGNLIVNNDTVENAYHSDKITTLAAVGGDETPENYGYGRGYSFDYNMESGNLLNYYSDMTYGMWGASDSGYGWNCTTDTVTFWLDVYFSGDLLTQALKGTLTAAVNVQTYSGYSNDMTYIGIGVIGYSTYPTMTYDASGNLIIQNCTSEDNPLNGMDSYRESNGDLDYTSAYACSTFIPAGAKGVRLIMRIVADGDMAAIFHELYLTFKTQFTQANYNTGITFGNTTSNSSQTFTTTSSANGSGTSIGYQQWNYSAPSAVKYYLSGNGLEFDNSSGNRATMGVNATLSSVITNSSNWNAGYALRLTLYATIGTTGSADYITIGLKAGHTSTADGNMSLDNTIYWNGYYRSNATNSASGDNNYVQNCILTKSMFLSGGLLASTTDKFTVIFDATADGGMGFSIKTINIAWKWILPVQAPVTVSSSNTLANGGGWNLGGNVLGAVPPDDNWNVWQDDPTNNEGLWNLNNTGNIFYLGNNHTTGYSLINQDNIYTVLGVDLGWRKPGVGFRTDTSYTYGVMALSFNMTNVGTKLQQNLGKSLSDYNMRISYYGEDKAVNSTADSTRVIAYPGLQYGANSSLIEANNFGVDETSVSRLGYESANDREGHSFTISLAVVAEYSNLFTLFVFFDPGSSGLDWYIYNLEFNLEEGGVQKPTQALVAKASDTETGSISTGYTTDGSNYTPLGYNAISVINQYTTYGKTGDKRSYLWGSGMSAMTYNATNGIGYAYTGGDTELENSGYAQMGTSVYIDTQSTDNDGKSLIDYANEGRLRISFEAILYSTGTADTITAGIYKRGMQLSSQFSPMLNTSLIPDNLSMSTNTIGTSLNYYSYYYYPYVAYNSSGLPITSSQNTLTQGTGIYSNYWGFSVFFQDLTTNALEMRVKYLNIKIEVMKDFEYDSISYLDDYLDTTIQNTAQASCSTYVFDTRAAYYSSNSATALADGSTSSAYSRSYTKAWGFYNLEDQNWWIASAAQNAELTHNVLTYSNYGTEYTNSLATGGDTKIGYGYESALGDVVTDTIAGSIGSIYTAPSQNATIGMNVDLTDRMWRLLEDGKTSGVQVTFSWSGMPNYNDKADTTGTYIKTGLNTFYAGWSDKLFTSANLACYADRTATAELSAVTNTPYSNTRPLTLVTENMVVNGTGAVTETNERIVQTYGVTTGTNYINTTDVSFTISIENLIQYASSSHAFSIYFSSLAYNSQNSMYVWDVSVELIPLMGNTVDTTSALTQITDDSYAPDSPVGVLPYVLDGQIANSLEIADYDVDGTSYNNNDYGTGIGSGKTNYYYNNMFYYSLGRTSVGAYTEYTIEFKDIESTMWGFEVWLGDYFTLKTTTELLNYTGARFKWSGSAYVYDKDGMYVPTYRLNTSISDCLTDWSDQDDSEIGNQWATLSNSVYSASYEALRENFNGNSLIVDAKWNENEAQYEGDYTAMYASMSLTLVSDALEPIRILGFNSMGMTSANPISLSTSRYDGTAPTMQVKTVTRATSDETSYYDLNANGVYDEGVDSLNLNNVFLSSAVDVYNASISANVYKSSWFVPGKNTLIAEFTDIGITDGEDGSISSGLGLMMPMRMVMTGDSATQNYEWELDVDESHAFNGSWQWYNSTAGQWLSIGSMTGTYASYWYTNNSLDSTPNSSLLDATDPTAYNIDYYDYGGIRTELTSTEIATQLYLNEIYLLTKYFVNEVREEVSHSTVNDVAAVRVRYVRNCTENNTFFFAAYDASGNIATDTSGQNSAFMSTLYAYKSYNSGAYNIDHTASITASPVSSVTGYVRNIANIYQEAVTVSYYNISTSTAFSSSTITSGLLDTPSATYTYTPQNGYMFVGWNLNTSQCATVLGAPNYLSGARVRKISNALTFDATYYTYYLSNKPHRQTTTDTNKLMPVQKVAQITATIYCYMAPIELEITESGSSSVVLPGYGA